MLKKIMERIKSTIKLNQRKFKLTVSILFIVIFTFISMGSTLNNDFVNWDDNTYVCENPLIKELSWKNITNIFTPKNISKERMYIPLTYLSYATDYAFDGLNPFVFHLSSLIWHILCILLCYRLAFILSKSTPISFACATIFAIHPMQVEAVAWIMGRKDLLSTFFALLSIILYIKYQKENKISFYITSIFTFLLGLLCKPTIAILPLLLVLIDYNTNKLFKWNLIINKLPYLIMAFGIVPLSYKWTVNVKEASGLVNLSLVKQMLLIPWQLVSYLQELCKF